MAKVLEAFDEIQSKLETDFIYAWTCSTHPPPLTSSDSSPKVSPTPSNATVLSLEPCASRTLTATYTAQHPWAEVMPRPIGLLTLT